MDSLLRVLIAEDSRDDTELLVLELQRGGYTPVVKRVESVEKICSALEEEDWDIILTDYEMPNFSVLSALKEIEKFVPAPPVIVVSGVIGMRRAVALMKAGARDFVEKDDLSRLVPAVKRELQEVVIREKNEQAERELHLSEERFRGAVESLQEGLALFDADDRLVAMNDQYRHYNPEAQNVFEAGGTFEDLLRSNIKRGALLDAIGREEEFLRERVAQHQNPGKPIIRQFSDGKTLMLREVRTPEGGIALTFIDISELKRTEETSQRLNTAIEAVSEKIALYDADDRLVFCNKSFRDFNNAIGDTIAVGARFEDFLTAAIEKGLMPEADGREREWLKDRLEKHKDPKGPFEMERQDGFFIRIHEEKLPDGGTLSFASDITERKAAEKALAENRERFRLILNSTGDGIYGIDQDGKCIFCNTACLRLLGHGSESDLLGQDMYALAHHTTENGAANSRTASGPYKAYKEGAGVHSDSEIFWRADGSSFPAEYRAFPLRSNGNILGAVVSFTDNTERRKGEKALLESEERFRLAFENSSVPMGLTELETGRFYRANAAYCRWLGYSEDEMLKMTIYDITHPDDRDRHAELRKHLVEEGAGNFEIEKRYVHKDGTIYWAELNTSLLHDGDGNVLYAHGQIRDITQQKRAEQGYNRLAAAIEELSDLMVLYDADDRLVACNRKFREFYLNSPHLAVPGTRFEDRQKGLVENGHIEGIEGREDEWMQERIRQHKNAGGSFETRRKGRWLLVREQRLPDGGTLTISTDITDQKKAEAEHKELEAQLRQSQKLQTIGTLANGIAHDFNNILSPILGYVDMALQDFPEDWQIHKNLVQVHTAAERAKALVHQILTTAGQGDQEQQPVKVTDIVKETMSLLRPSLPPMIEIIENLDEADLPVFADPTQIHQVVMNLCTNAYQAMEKTGGNLTISTDMVGGEDVLPGRTVSEDWRYVRLSVSDTGGGMDAKQVTRIFEPFYTTKEVGEGTGLGLSVVHGIVSSHGGTITVDSKPGEGSRFNVYLPVMEGATAEAGASKEISTMKGSERVLYVDDEEEIAEMGQQMLERMGHRVTLASNAIEALKVFEADPDRFDVVITDHAMPKMTGIDLAEALLELRPGLPIVLMTGSGEVINRARKQQIGINVYLMKPIVMHELSSAIKSAMGTERAS